MILDHLTSTLWLIFSTTQYDANLHTLGKSDFEMLKEAFRDCPVRGFPDYESEQPVVINTDCQAINMATILSQV